MKKQRIIYIGLVLLVILAGLALVFQGQLNQWRTLASLQKVDDYPFFVMTYYGDYGFKDFLQEGVQTNAYSQTNSRETGEWGCTVFAALNENGSLVLGRNLDWHNHAVLLLYTDPPDGYASVSMIDIFYLGYDDWRDTWRSRQELLEAPYWPFDGMNEMGLAVGMMAVPYTGLSQDPEKVTIRPLQAIRLMLDYAGDVDEAIALLQNYNLVFRGGPAVHYLIADAAGNSGVIEFVDGEMVVLRPDEPWQVSTNFVISREQPEGADTLCWRYNRAYETLAEANGKISSSDAMTLLQNVSQDSTMWSVVYGMKTGNIQIVLDRNYDKIREFKLEMMNMVE
jgi:hypothetical protein